MLVGLWFPIYGAGGEGVEIWSRQLSCLASVTPRACVSHMYVIDAIDQNT